MADITHINTRGRLTKLALVNLNPEVFFIAVKYWMAKNKRPFIHRMSDNKRFHSK